MNEVAARRLLRRRVEQIGPQRRAAVELGVSLSYLSDALAGRRSLGPKLLSKIGLRRIERGAEYVKVAS